MSIHSRNLSNFPIDSEFKYLKLNDPLVRLLFVFFNTTTVKKATRVSKRPLELEYGAELTCYKLCPQAQVLPCSLNSFFSQKCLYIQNFQSKGSRCCLSNLAFPRAGSFQDSESLVFRRFSGFSSSWGGKGPHTCLRLQSAAADAVRWSTFTRRVGSSLAHLSVTEIKYVMRAGRSHFKQGASPIGPNRCVQNILTASFCHLF